jgi:DNA-binding NtrC family response regulator
MRQLQAYSWPGNVRQLEHVIERAVILGRSGEVTAVHLPTEPHSQRSPPRTEKALPPAGTTLQEALASYERKVIIAALRSETGVQARAARRLGLSRSNLNYRINKLGIQIKDIRYE